MKLDDFSLAQLNVQLKFPAAFELWDAAGELARALSGIWPNLKLLEAAPDRQVLRSRAVQLTTSMDKCHIGINKLSSADQFHEEIAQTFSCWTAALELDSLDQVSARHIYHRKMQDLGAANRALRELGVVRWPSRKVFGQSMESELNGIHVTYKLEDDDATTVVQLKTELIQLEITSDNALEEFDPIVQMEARVVLDIDRAVKKATPARDLNITSWLEGVRHLIRRDVNSFLAAGND